MAAVAYSQFTAHLVFADERRRTLDQRALVVTLGRMLGPNWLLRASLVRVLGGEINGGGRAVLDPGWSIGAQLSRRWSVDNWPALYLGASVALAASWTTASYEGETAAHDLMAADLRLGGVVGWTLAEVLTPYAAGRVFGGPVSWRTMSDGEAQAGTDRYHVQLAAGLSARLPAGLYWTAEWAAVGEQALSSELGVRF